MSRRKLVITGPTASGKSDLAMEIAGNDFEIVSADSVQVYRYMDIGSCKPSDDERKKVRHYMIDIVDPDYRFTAGEYCTLASSVCVEIYNKKMIPMFVGGTGLYIDSFFSGISHIPDISPDVKSELNREIELKGSAVLYSELQKADPEFADKIHINDRQRIVRGLEVFRGTGRPLSSFYHDKISFSGDGNLFIGIFRDKEELRQRISMRTDLMIKRGFVDEVIKLREMGYTTDLNSMQSIGYSEINSYLDNKTDLKTAVENIKINTKKYTKKQMTWFKRNKDIIWLAPSEIKKTKNIINNWLKNN